ncbi:MAG: S-adenosylmethionine synthetase N-terminal domain-containing protein [Anaerococcus sp.]|nr:S-adenosylmethionine synthetase N-terminal domain-containing protein [Anaerococcus sp.]
MFEKVNPKHPDKIADRIAGAIVDLAYQYHQDPKIAVEVLIGHGECNIIIESSCFFDFGDIQKIVKRIAGIDDVEIIHARQDKYLAENQVGKVRCGDNGIFKGSPVTEEQKKLTSIAEEIYKEYGADGKSILDDDRLIICQSKAKTELLQRSFPTADINPIGDWSGGLDVDTGCTNRKLGSDMGDGVTGGGLHGKDLSKADVSVNIYAHLKAQETGKEVNISCAIGDEIVDGKPYSEIVDIARRYIYQVGGFEKLAEWGLI